MGGVGVQRVLKLLKYIPRHNIEPVIVTTSCNLHKIMDYRLDELEYVRSVPIYRLGGEELRNLLERRMSGARPTVNDLIFALKTIRHMDIYSAWSLGIIPHVVEIVKKEKVDLIYSTSPPHSVHLLAKKLKQVTGIPWVMELRDSLTDWPLRKGGVIGYIQSVIESWYEPRLYDSADGIIFVTQYQRKHAIDRCPELVRKSTEVILNGFDDEELNIRKISPDADILRVVYTGSLIDFEIEKLCEGFKLYERTREKTGKKIELTVVGPVGVHARAHLQSLGKHINVNLVGTVDHAEALEYQQSAHCLLLVQTADYRGKGSEILTGKVFEYIGARRPIIAAVKPGELQDLIIDNNFGVVADPFDPGSVCAAISSCADIVGEFYEQHAGAPDQLEKFTRKHQVARTADFVRSLINTAEQ